jgi:uncharacterized membrane protein YidH (DUF202 family)
MYATVGLMGTAFQEEGSRLVPAVMLALSALAVAAGIGFCFMAWKRTSLPFGVSGVVLLLAAPALAVVASLAANSPRDRGPMRADCYIDGIHRAESTLRMIRRVRAHVGVAAASVFLVWACEALELTDFPVFALCLTLLVAIAAAGYLPWLARQEKLVLEQSQRLRRELGTIQIAEKWFAG